MHVDIDDIENPYDLSLDQQLILKALSNEPPHHLKYLQQWFALIDLDAINYPTLKMIPAVYQRFGEQSLPVEYIPRIKGIYRYFLLKTNLLLSDGLCIVKKILAAGIPVLLFKGTALTLAYYKNPALRPMNDVDILIQKKHLNQVEAILLAHDFHYRYAETEKLRYLHSYDYVNTKQHGLDVHWQALYENTAADIDEKIWQRARWIEWEGMSMPILSAEDLILTTLVNGFRDLSLIGPHKTEEMHWIYDVIMIIQGEKIIAWDILYSEAQARGLTEIIFHGLRVIQRLSDTFISAELIHRFFLNNEEFYMPLLGKLIAEGRGQAIKDETLQEVYVPAQTHQKYVKYYLNTQGDIETISFPRQFSPFISEVFKVSHQRKFKKMLTQALKKSKENNLKVDVSWLALKNDTAFMKHKAQITILNPSLKSHYLPGEMLVLDLSILQKSNHCWLLDPECKKQIGVSYHLFSDKNKVIAWDFMRQYFFAPQKNYVNFITPGTHIRSQLTLMLPTQPGNYKLALDIVQEGVNWFSKKGNVFPTMSIQVVSSDESVVLKKNLKEAC